ncbi:hypothetical protein V500_10639 [Pseudogymnoascus sp. VKM F-4518 (FW-2643)]|nr:hypothetical protein V500_10639 [Pseudogymnoascus sp. VKM F-4518 (FW-2643)]
MTCIPFPRLEQSMWLTFPNMVPYMRLVPRGIVARIGLILLSLAAAAAMDVCSDCPNAERWSAPGVGFDLTLDYGTSAVHFLDGTTVPNAAIEGSVAYKQQMRELVETAVASNWTGTFQGPVPVPSWFQYIQGLIGCKLPPSPSPLQLMLGILKTDTEAYLGHAIHFAEVSFPAWLALDSYQVRTIDLALKQIGITRTARVYSQAIRAAARLYETNKLPNSIASTQARWMLGLDYSRSALVIAIEEIDDEIFQNFAWKFRTNLGQDSAWNHPSDPRVQSLIAKPHYWEVVEEELRQALEFLGDAKIEDLILVGDRIIANEHLLDILRKVLGTETCNNAIRKHTALQNRGVMVNPLFAAAMGQARLSHAVRDKSPSGCFYAGNCPGAGPLHSGDFYLLAAADLPLRIFGTAFVSELSASQLDMVAGDDASTKQLRKILTSEAPQSPKTRVVT